MKGKSYSSAGAKVKGNKPPKVSKGKKRKGY